MDLKGSHIRISLHTWKNISWLLWGTM